MGSAMQPALLWAADVMQLQPLPHACLMFSVATAVVGWFYSGT